MASWVEKFGKPQHSSAMDTKENDISITDVSFVRVGSAYAKTQGADKETLVQLLEKFVEEINVHYDPNTENHIVTIKNLD